MVKLLLGKLLFLLHGEIVVGEVSVFPARGNCCLVKLLLWKLVIEEIVDGEIVVGEIGCWGSCDWGGCAGEIT